MLAVEVGEGRGYIRIVSSALFEGRGRRSSRALGVDADRTTCINPRARTPRHKILGDPSL